MQAVINLSDEGSRLRPLSCVRNAGMLTICNMTLIERLLQLLVRHDIHRVTIITGYMASEVMAQLKKIETGAVIEYVAASSQAEALKECAEKIKEDFIYFSKPVYAEFDIKALTEFHKKRNSFITVLTARGINEGIVCDKTGRVTRIEEKRMWSSISGEQGFGIYVINRRATNFLTKNSNGEFNQSVLEEIVRSGKMVYSKMIDGVCENTNDTSSYMRACFAFLEMMKKTACNGICVCEGAVVEKGALLESPCYIGKGAHIHKGAKIGAFSQIGEGCVVSEGANIKRSIVSDNCRVGPFVTLRGCILDENVKCGKGSTVYEQAVIGKKTSVGADVLVKSFVKIWPEKTIEKGVIVSENIMWGQKKRSKLFECGKIKGVVNVDITPVFCTLLGSASGMLFASGEVGISTDDSTSGAMLRDAIAAGLLGAGCSVKDFGEQPLPITRRGTAFYSLQGAVCVSVHSLSGEDVAEISVIGKHGFDIDEVLQERLEELFEKGDVVYPESKNIKECEYVFEYKLYYLKGIIGYKTEKRLPTKILLSCPATWGRRLISSAMADFSCPVSMYQDGVFESETGRESFALSQAAGGFDIGFMMDGKCEKLKIAVGGQILDDDTYEVLCSLIVMRKYSGAKIYVPATVSQAVEKLAQKYNCTVIRTKTTPLEIMRQMSGGEKYLSDEFIFRFDAVGAVILFMDYLTREGVNLSTLLDEIPPITMNKTIVDIPEGKLDDIMDKIQEMPDSSEAAEGVKITFDKGWVIVIPDMEKEVFKVVSEASRAEIAKELCDICISKIQEK